MNVTKRSGVQTRKTNSLEELYGIESINMTYRGLLTSPLPSYLLSVILVSYWLHDKTYLEGDIRVWWALMAIAASLEAFTMSRYTKTREPSKRNVKKWHKSWLTSTVIIGVCFSYVFLLVDTNQLEAAVFVLGMHGFNILSASLYVSLTPRTMAAYLAMSLTIGAYAFWGSPYLIQYALLSMIALVGNAAFSAKIKSLFTSSIALRFKNEQLIEELKSQKEIAESANVAKTKFLAAASHDLRQPLQSLSLLISALFAHIETDKQHQILDKAKLSLSALSELLDSLLDISKLDAELITSRPIQVGLKALLSQEIQKLEPAIREKGLTISLNYEGSEEIFSDPILLSRIFGNIISNACRYTLKGEIQIHAYKTSKGDTAVKFKDTGIGIPQDELKHIFTEFYQVENMERDREKGLGLGLSIVRRLCKILGAHIEVNSEQGKGSTFKLTIPGCSYINEINTTTHKVRESTAADLSKLSILVIDDEIMIRDSMTLLLEGWGCEVAAFGDLESALKRLDSSELRPDALVVDYRLRENMKGTHCINEINQALENTLPALVITGDTAPERVTELELSGFPFIHKPINANDLREFLSKVKHQS